MKIERPEFADWALDMARDYAGRGTCGRRLAGAVAIDAYGRVLGMGMNGVPRGFPHCRYDLDGGCPGLEDVPGNTENCYAIHAEANMILNCGDPYSIVKVYVTVSPCKNCALLLCNLPNIHEVIYREEYSDRRGILLLRRRGVKTTLLPGSADLS